MPYPIVLCSDMCTGEYPNNYGGKFVNTLNEAIDFTGGDNWGVALKEIYYMPDSWDNVRDGGNEFQIGTKQFYRWNTLKQ